jgi:hypothetical protein
MAALIRSCSRCQLLAVAGWGMMWPVPEGGPQSPAPPDSRSRRTSRTLVTTRVAGESATSVHASPSPQSFGICMARLEMLASQAPPRLSASWKAINKPSSRAESNVARPPKVPAHRHSPRPTPRRARGAPAWPGRHCDPHQQYLRRSWALGERGLQRSTGLLPPQLGISAKDDADAQSVVPALVSAGRGRAASLTPQSPWDPC